MDQGAASRTSPLQVCLVTKICKEVQPVHPKGDQSWVFIGRTDVDALATWCEELTRLKRAWCWERLRAGGEGDARGWDGWMASPTRWTWVWVDSRRWWWTGSPGVLWFMGSQRVGHDWATELSDQNCSSLLPNYQKYCCLENDWLEVLIGKQSDWISHFKIYMTISLALPVYALSCSVMSNSLQTHGL